MGSTITNPIEEENADTEVQSDDGLTPLERVPTGGLLVYQNHRRQQADTIQYGGQIAVPDSLRTDTLLAEICTSFYLREGHPEAINTWDGKVITLGPGFAGANAIKYLRGLLDVEVVREGFAYFDVSPINQTEIKIKGDTVSPTNYLAYFGDTNVREFNADGTPPWFYEAFVEVLSEHPMEASENCWELFYTNPIGPYLAVINYFKLKIEEGFFATSLVPRIALHSVHWRSSLLNGFAFSSTAETAEVDMLKELLVYYLTEAAGRGGNWAGVKPDYLHNFNRWLAVFNEADYFNSLFSTTTPESGTDGVDYFELTHQDTSYYLIK